MKILFDARVHLNYFSGISRYIICLLEAYAQEFPEDELQVLINPTIEDDNAIFKTLSSFDNVIIERINMAHMGPKNYTSMGKIVKKINPDIYHYPHLDAPVYTGKIPVVATIHDTNSGKKVKKFDDKLGLKSLYFKKSVKLTLKKADKVLFVSDSIKKEVLDNYGYDLNDPKFIRMYNGLEADFNSLSESEGIEIRKGLKLPDQYLFYVGQIREHKNVYRIIEAFKNFYPEHPSFKLVMVGHNYLNLTFQDEMIQHVDRVSNQELKAIYQGCKGLIFPSLFEGFGFPIIEAFSYKKPVLTSNYGAMKEVSGDLAILVDPFSVESITAGLHELIQEDNLGEKRLSRSQAFSWQENAIALRKIYSSLITA